MVSDVKRSRFTTSHKLFMSLQGCNYKHENTSDTVNQCKKKKKNSYDNSIWMVSFFQDPALMIQILCVIPENKIKLIISVKVRK